MSNLIWNHIFYFIYCDWITRCLSGNLGQPSQNSVRFVGEGDRGGMSPHAFYFRYEVSGLPSSSHLNQLKLRHDLFHSFRRLNAALSRKDPFNSMFVRIITIEDFPVDGSSISHLKSSHITIRYFLCTSGLPT